MQSKTVALPRRLANQYLLIYELYRHGEAVFDGLANFRSWLEHPNTALSDKRSIDLFNEPARI